MILFLDTEFTGLDHRWPRLISIGLDSEDGEHWFYAESTKDTHGNVDFVAEGGCRIVSNQLGYPKDLSPGFRPGLVQEV